MIDKCDAGNAFNSTIPAFHGVPIPSLSVHHGPLVCDKVKQMALDNLKKAFG